MSVDDDFTIEAASFDRHRTSCLKPVGNMFDVFETIWKSAITSPGSVKRGIFCCKLVLKADCGLIANLEMFCNVFFQRAGAKLFQMGLYLIEAWS
jgi:hypothetical protein